MPRIKWWCKRIFLLVCIYLGQKYVRKLLFPRPKYKDILTGTNLTSLQSRSGAEHCANLMDQVYGEFTGDEWTPKLFDKLITSKTSGDYHTRYLWTDACGVVNYLNLYDATGEQKYLKQAKRLIEHTHDVLGRTRDGSRRLGNATDSQPLIGGLRIGKPYPDGAEMPNDGQYYHYLCKWLFALNTIARATGDRTYNDAAISLVKSIHPKFLHHRPNGQLWMPWKMNSELTEILVPLEGALDSFNGFVVYRRVQEVAENKSILAEEIAQMAEMVGVRVDRYNTNDPLDAGDALWMAHYYPEEPWAKIIRRKAEEGLDNRWKRGYFNITRERRLAFREFGATLGVQLFDDTRAKWQPAVDLLHAFWLDHLFDRDADMTPVMFCSSVFKGWFY